MNKKEIIDYFKVFSFDSEGFEGWLSKEIGKDDVFNRLLEIEQVPLSHVQLNQLLVLSNSSGVSDGFFQYYWFSNPLDHTYEVSKLEDYREDFIDRTSIQSLQHLRWGIRRIYYDGLLYFGNVKFGFKELRTKKENELIKFFKDKRIPTDEIIKRGNTLKFEIISRDNRYLIAENACKTFGEVLS